MPVLSVDEVLRNFSDSVDKLLAEPTIENAVDVQLKNMVSWAAVYDTYLVAGYVDEITETFLRNSYDSLAGLELALNPNNSGQINAYKDNISRRIDFAEGSRKFGTSYISLKLDEYMRAI